MYWHPTCLSCHSARRGGITGLVPPKPLIAKCPLCFGVFPRDKLVADHKHETYWKTTKEGNKRYKGPFRAYLCSACNVRVGYFECNADVYKRTLDFVNTEHHNNEKQRSLKEITDLYKDLYKRARLLNEQH